MSNNDIITAALPVFDADTAKCAVTDVLDVYWVMLMDMESRTNPESDILRKNDVEAAYRVWNRVHPDAKPMTPRWMK